MFCVAAIPPLQTLPLECAKVQKIILYKLGLHFVGNKAKYGTCSIPSELSNLFLRGAAIIPLDRRLRLKLGNFLWGVWSISTTTTMISVGQIETTQVSLPQLSLPHLVYQNQSTISNRLPLYVTTLQASAITVSMGQVEASINSTCKERPVITSVRLYGGDI